MTATIRIEVSEKLYLRDPDETELGRSIVSEGIRLIEKLGFEKFTFKKLATEISSTEASVYRYFESKHAFLVYVVSWYWSWIEFMIDYELHNVSDPRKRLKIILATLAQSGVDDPRTTHINEAVLHRVVVSESQKAFLVHEVKQNKKRGVYRGFESLVAKIKGVLLELNPKYKYAMALSTGMVTLCHRQLFYAENLQNLTDLRMHKTGDTKDVQDFLEDLILKTLGVAT